VYISATLPYDIETLISFIAGYHQTIWPLQLLTLFLSVVILWLVKQQYKTSSRLIGTLLSFFWLLVGFVFYIFSFSNISFLAPYVGALFILEALLIFHGCVFRNRLSSQNIVFSKNKVAIGLLALSLFIYPALVFLFTKSLSAIPVVGVTPLATSVYTLGILGMLRGPFALKLALCTIPILHIILSVIFAGLLLF